jgi:hypothetical protein
MTLTVESVVLRLKRGDSPFFRACRNALKFSFTAAIPVPQTLKPAGRLFYELRFYIPMLWARVKSLIYTTPVFCCRCESVGKHLQLGSLPYVRGHTLLYIGDDVRFSGNLGCPLEDSATVPLCALAAGPSSDTMRPLPAIARWSSKTMS